MNKRIRTSYPPEFKLRAVELAKTGERSVRQLEVELGLSANLLRQWVQQYDKYGEHAWIRRASGDEVKTTSPEAAGVAGSNGNGGLRLQFEQLQRQYRQLQQDNAILKKALTIFAQESK
jgi:transposase